MWIEMFELMVICACVYCVYLGCKQDLQAQRTAPQHIPRKRITPRERITKKECKTDQPSISQVVTTTEEREEPQLPSYSEVTNPNRTSHP